MLPSVRTSNRSLEKLAGVSRPLSVSNLLSGDFNMPLKNYTIFPATVTPRFTRIWNYAIFKSRRFVLLFIYFVTESQAESVPEPDGIGNLIEEVADLARQINLEVDSDEAQELMDSHSQEQTMDLIEIHEQKQEIEGT
ncbi:hypothetical protein TNCV_2966231 [Trichonephila clavipes]|nr:hypothetical protein TNCV_2966231 [Trichonephila clavipes]